ncbi:MAG: hypothetical protein RR473_07170 [Comamonas sp.]
MNTPSLQTAHVQAVLTVSAQHLLGPDSQQSIAQYLQLWQAAQASGNRQAQQSIRQQVVSAGRQIQARRCSPQARALWLALLQLRCSMVMPRMRF